MNILFVSGIYPPDIGGPATYVSRMAYELKRRGHGVYVITLGEKDEWLKDPIPVRKVPRGENIALRCWRMLRAALIVGKESDIIYATGSPWDSWIISIIAAKLLRKSLVFKIVGDPVWEWAQRSGKTTLLLDDFSRAKEGIFIEFLKLFRNYSVRFADMIVTPSVYLKGVVEKWKIKPHYIEVIYNAVENIMEEKIELRNREREVVTVARLTPWKGIDGLIRIATLLPPDVKIVIIGDGPLKLDLMEQVKSSGMERRVVFTGRLPKGEVLKRLTRASIFVLNSQYEGLSHTLLEAMASGAAVVVTNVGGNAEVVSNGKNGFLIHSGDEKSLLERIKMLLDDDKMRIGLVGQALKDVYLFSWPRAVSQTESFFSSILA